MGLQNVRVECARAESLDLHDRFDLVTARAVGNPAAIFEIAGNALHREGVLMLYASADQKFDDEANAKAAAVGLTEGAIAGYDLRHGRATVEHAVATWVRR
jgi:16S rRNA G527 N7-methylase RsmG